TRARPVPGSRAGPHGPGPPRPRGAARARPPRPARGRSRAPGSRAGRAGWARPPRCSHLVLGLDDRRWRARLLAQTVRPDRGLALAVAHGTVLERVALGGRQHGRAVRDVPLLARAPHLARLALDDGLEDLGELGLVERLLREQLEHELVEHVAVLGEDLPRLVVRVVHELAHLEVDARGELLGVVALVAHVAPEEHLARVLAELDRAHGRAHAELRDHLAGDRGRL